MRTEGLHVTATLAMALALAACEPEEVVPTVPERDGAVVHEDGGRIVRRLDGGQDGGPSMDAAGLDGGTVDGGARRAPTIDGVISASEWDGALVETSFMASVEPFEFDRLERVLAIRTATRLFVAIDGMLGGATSVMMVLLDADFTSANGVLLSGTLSDFDGPLDLALSAPVWSSTVADFRPDYAWGTNIVPFGRTGADESTGWREIESVPGEFQYLGTSTVSACTGAACETSIALGPGGIAVGDELALVVRLGNGVGDLSNQTLPMDDPAVPEAISVVLRIPAP